MAMPASETKKPHLAFLDQIANRSSHVFHGHLGIDTVLIKEVDIIRLQSLEGLLKGLSAYCWAW